MKKKLTRTVAVVLAAVMAWPPAALASQALGTEVHRVETALGQGVHFVQQSLWSATYSDLRTEQYMEYTPNELVQPVLAYGDSVRAKNTLSALAKKLEQEGNRVLGGINGDYFVLATGAPLGIVVTDGVLRSSSAYHHALGFYGDGTAFIGQPSLAITASFRDYTFAVSGGLNKVRTETGGYVLYTQDYGVTTNHSSSGVDVILSVDTSRLGERIQVQLEVEDIPESEGGGQPEPVQEELPAGEEGTVSESIPEDSAGITEEELIQPEQVIERVADTLVYTDVPRIGGRLQCTVEQVLHSEKSIDIPAGKLVLSINNQSNEWLVSELAALRPGDSVEIDITTEDERWESAVTAVGGLYKMVTGGVAETGLETAQGPRSAVGLRADGSMVFYTVDGRLPGHSVGASMGQVAKRLIELGCVEAVCMDGGGSTAAGVTYPGEDSFSVVNRPSDGGQRAVTNALFLTARKTSPGPARFLAVEPLGAVMLPGTAVEMSAAAMDAVGQKTTGADAAVFDIPAGAGILSGGVFTAGTAGGTHVITVRAGALTGQTVITVVPVPDKITLTDESSGRKLSSVKVEPGGKVELGMTATWRNLTVLGGDTDVSWAVTPELGSIDEDGTFTAGQISGSGSIRVTAGKKTVSIPLSVAGHVYAVEDFEGSFDNMAGSDTAAIEPEQRSAYVRWGRQSAKLTYDVGEAPYAAVGVNFPIREGEKYLSLWIYGDGSGNTLAMPVRGADGAVNDAILAVLNFTGWQQVITPVPVGTQDILVLKLLPEGNASSGAIWLDQITTSNQYAPDLTAPTVELTVDGNRLQAQIGDNMDESFPNGSLQVSMDGRPLVFISDGTRVEAQLPEADSAAHRVTVTVTDTSGNIGRASADLPAAEGREPVFADIEGHWAEYYVNYLYDQEISNGVAVDGRFCFQPDKKITRGEFALMAARWLRLDLTQYSLVELPFADLEEIPVWAMDGIKAMYALGVMQGSAEGDGIYAFAEKSITRAEAMTMLGRMQPRGYAVAELNFADAGNVPAWAADYIRTLAAQGVINGYADNTIAPNAPIARSEIAKILYAMR